jgi:threonine/homoserine/homoserine lactone efflux protein
MVGALLVGLLLGIGSSLLPGPCGLAVLAAARQHGRARAVATAFGAATGDALYASLGVFGVGALVQQNAELPPLLHAMSGAVMIGLGYHVLRARPRGAPTAGGARRGFATGLGLLLGNPAAMLTWTVLVGAAGPASVPERVALVVGIACGTASWFGLLALALPVTGARLRHVTRLASTLLIGYGVFLVLEAAT